MNMKQCTRGHYYDTDLHMQCPYCSGNTGSVIDSVTGAIGYTMPINPGQVSGGAGGDKTVAFSESASTASNNDGRTMAFI